MLLDLKFSIGTLGIGSGALLAGFFGMNLKNFMEESDLGLIGVTGSTVVVAVVVCVFGLQKLRRVQRVSMWDERGRGSWNPIEPGPRGHRTRAIQGWKGRDLEGVLGPNGSKNSDFGPQPDLSMQMAAAIPSVAMPPLTSPTVAGGKSKQKRSPWRKEVPLRG